MNSENHCMDYKSKIEENVEKDKIKLTMDFNDGTKKTKHVPSFDGSKGIEHLLFVEERFRKAAEKLALENEELYEFFGEIVTGNAQMEWDLIEQELNEDEKTTERFWELIHNQFYRKYCSSDARDVMFDYLSNKCKKPVGMEPRDHVNRMRILYRYSNQLPGLEPIRTAEQQKLSIFRTFPESWRRSYIRAGRRVENDSLQEIVDFMTNEKGFADAEQKERKGKFKTETGNNNDSMERKRNIGGRGPKGGRGKTPKKIVGSNDPCPHHFGNHTWGQCFNNPDGMNFRPRNTGPGGRGTGRGGRSGRGFYGRNNGRGNGNYYQNNAQPNNFNNTNRGNTGGNGHQNYHNEMGVSNNIRGETNITHGQTGRDETHHEHHHLEMVGQDDMNQNGLHNWNDEFNN